jgi:NitT/TauT family transport system substrate-binding protein
MALNKRRNLIIIAVIALVVVVSLSSFIYVNSPKPYTGNLEPITLGVYPSEYNSLIYIANNQQYFYENGLKVAFINYTSGASAVTGMLKGEVDISTASEFVVVNNGIRNESISALGTISKYLNVFLVARTDMGINSVSDLAGKRIGVLLGTANQFFLGRYLEINGIDQSKVTLVNLKFVDTPEALANGTIDAAVANPPYTNQIQKLLPNTTITFPIQSNQFGYFEAISSRDWANAHPDLIARFLKALIQAEDFNINHKDQAISSVAKDLNYTISYATSIWSDYQYSVTLDQSFVLLMQEEGRWLIRNNLTNATSIPNFLNYIYVDGLKTLRPESVNVIGLGD